MRDGRIEIWAPTQVPNAARKKVAELNDLPIESVKLHQMRIGGGFGRRLISDFVCEAAAIAARFDGPVKLQWSREDDMMHDFVRVAGHHHLAATLTPTGDIAAWRDHFVTFSGDGESPVSGGSMDPDEFPLPLIANSQLERTMLPLMTPTGPWRAPGSNGIAFAIQCFLHELAIEAGRDHLDFLVGLLGEPRLLGDDAGRDFDTGRARRVLERVAEIGRWGRPSAPDSGRGLAFHFSHRGYVAEIASVSVSGQSEVHVDEVLVVADAGLIVNPAGAEKQLSGAVIDGLSAMAGQSLTFLDGRAIETNFDRYRLMPGKAAPNVSVHFIDSDRPPTGLGEPALPPLAPAVCNAIAAATGKRIRRLPLSESGFRLV